MKKFLILATALSLLALNSIAGPPNALTASEGAFAPNSTGYINQTTGYMGTASYDLDNTYSVAVNYYLCYEVDVYVYDGEYEGWNVYQVGYLTGTAPVGSHSVTVDFTADLTTGIPAGTYNVSIFVAKIGTGGVVGSILTTGGDGDNDDAFVNSSSAVPGTYALPSSEPPPGPDPGDNPPVVYPILPPGGASGPGSIHVT